VNVITGVGGLWFNTEEVAAQLRLSPTTVRAAARAGKLAATWYKGRWRITPEAVAQYSAIHLNRQGWGKRRAADYESDEQQTRQARYQRAYRERLRRVKAEQDGYGDDVGETITRLTADLEHRDPDEVAQLRWSYQGVYIMIREGRLAEMPRTSRASHIVLVRLLIELEKVHESPERRTR